MLNSVHYTSRKLNRILLNNYKMAANLKEFVFFIHISEFYSVQLQMYPYTLSCLFYRHEMIHLKCLQILYRLYAYVYWPTFYVNHL